MAKLLGISDRVGPQSIETRFLVQAFRVPCRSNVCINAGLCHEAEGYFKSKVTIHEAIRAGLPLDAAELERGIDDREAWEQEYLCQFMDTSSVLLPYDLLASRENADASEHSDPAALSRKRGALYAGIDFGRKRHSTVCWIIERTGEELWTREVLVLPGSSTPEQIEALRPRLQRCQRVCLDYTGGGIGLGDYLAREFGAWNPAAHQHGKIELCPFTPELKGLRQVSQKPNSILPSLFRPLTSKACAVSHLKRFIQNYNALVKSSTPKVKICV